MNSWFEMLVWQIKPRIFSVQKLPYQSLTTGINLYRHSWWSTGTGKGQIAQLVYGLFYPTARKDAGPTWLVLFPIGPMNVWLRCWCDRASPCPAFSVHKMANRCRTNPIKAYLSKNKAKESMNVWLRCWCARATRCPASRGSSTGSGASPPRTSWRYPASASPTPASTR